MKVSAELGKYATCREQTDIADGGASKGDGRHTRSSLGGTHYKLQVAYYEYNLQVACSNLHVARYKLQISSYIPAASEVAIQATCFRLQVTTAVGAEVAVQATSH